MTSVGPALSIQLLNFSAAEPGSDPISGGWEPLLARARAADQAGIDRLVVSDHVVLGENLGAYSQPELGGVAGGRQPTGPDGHWLEPLTLLSVIAGMTSHCRLQTGILIAALRRPVVLAKMASTLDVLSAGRLDLGVGVGWQKEEYEAAGLAFETRGDLLERSLEICQTFWREGRASYDDDDLHFQNAHMMPKPLQPGGIPIWVSGRMSARLLRRIVRFGSGWIPWGDDAKDPTSAVAGIREALEAAGRKPHGFQVAGTLPVVRAADTSLDLERTMERVPALVEAGITDFRVHLPIPADPGAAVDYLSNWVSGFRKAVGR
ncbi:MAG: TIGR03619 family F420-dependent LLM class oxidoreductase [Deltaproteobacteria bacterium]|nr:TIGR03619 family F420-dependent LLM class oxidoreductase [Deltaproteobacteria bacterium]MBW2393783.1 TIGR03619 family F420-dependent LLM class oxidoreductase [Deltaproteobacteria bacterium]